MAQRVLITAGASGIGKEVARAYATIGAQVCICDINEKALDTATKDIPGLKTVVCDVSKRADVERMVAASVETLGGLDALVNNAGIAGPTAPVEDVDPDQWEAVMTVDVIGTFHVTRHSIPHLKKIPCRQHHHHVIGRRTLRLSKSQRILHGPNGADRIREDAVA